MKKIKILVVEDNPIVAEDLKIKLENLGYDVTATAYSGKEALESVRKNLPDIALMDIRLGEGMNGIDTAHELKSVHNVPVIYLTAHADGDTVSRAKRTEPYGYIVKPFDDNQLRSVIDIAVYKQQVDRELRESRAELRKREEQLRAIFTAANRISFIITDIRESGPVITEFSAGAERIFGFPRSEMVGKPISLLQLTDKVKIVDRSHPERHARDADLSGKTVLHRKSGEGFPALFSTHPLFDEENGLYAGLFVCVDISEQERLEKNLRHSEKMVSIGNLAGGIAHDFNNILASIIGFNELALDDAGPDSPLAGHLKEVRAAGHRAKDLVQQILTFARQSDDKIGPIRPRVIAKEVLKFIRSSIPTDIEIQQHIESGSYMMGNATQVHQILMNLCTNAAQAMETTGGVLTVRMRDVVIGEPGGTDVPGGPGRDGLKPGEYIKLAVSDTGVGIPPDIIHSIFEPYFTTKEVGEGTGMGLAVVIGIVEKYGGKIFVESGVNRGTVFTLYLPRTDTHSATRGASPNDIPLGTERILFIDDEPALTRMACQQLGKLGYRVTAQNDSRASLVLFKEDPNAFDLVITDMTMPGMTGDRLAAEMMTIRPDIPIIMCTGYSKRISDEKAREIGISAFGLKPFKKAELAGLIRQVLDTPTPG